MSQNFCVASCCFAANSVHFYVSVGIYSLHSRCYVGHIGAFTQIYMEFGEKKKQTNKTMRRFRNDSIVKRIVCIFFVAWFFME